MSIPVTIPRLGWNMEEGTFLEWRKRDGDVIKPGDVLYVLESEKAAEEIETLDGGILGIPADAPRPGDRVKVGQVIGHLLAKGEALPVADVKASQRAMAPVAMASAAPRVPPAASPSVRRLARQLGVEIAELVASGRDGTIREATVRSQATSPMPVETKPTTGRRRIAISPRARRVARELGIDWNHLSGSGRNGRIRERDIRQSAASAVRGRLIPHTSVRRAIAARMVAGVTQAAPVTLHAMADAEQLVALRRRLKEKATAGPPAPAYADMILRLAAAALRDQPLLRAQWRDDGLFIPEPIDIAFAVDTEHGLFAPVIRGADRLSWAQIAEQSQTLTDRARAGKLTAEDMRDAVFTITNLGMHGVATFTPIITPPQCAVLGIGRIDRVPVVVGDAIVPRHQAALSLTFDHRIVDGAPAARFLRALCTSIGHAQCSGELLVAP